MVISAALCAQAASAVDRKFSEHVERGTLEEGEKERHAKERRKVSEVWDC